MDMGRLAEGTVITNIRYAVPEHYTSGTEFGRDYWAAVDHARERHGRHPEITPTLRPFVTVDVRATLVEPDGRKVDTVIERDSTISAIPAPGEEVARRFAAEWLAKD